MTDFNKLYSLLYRGPRLPEGRRAGWSAARAPEHMAAIKACSPDGDPLFASFCADQAVQCVMASMFRGRLLELDPVNTYKAPLAHLWAPVAVARRGSASVSLPAAAPRRWCAAAVSVGRLRGSLVEVYVDGVACASVPDAHEDRVVLDVPGLGSLTLFGWDGLPVDVDVRAPFARPLTELAGGLASSGMPWTSPGLELAFRTRFELRERVAAGVLNLLEAHAAHG